MAEAGVGTMMIILAWLISTLSSASAFPPTMAPEERGSASITEVVMEAKKGLGRNNAWRRGLPGLLSAKTPLFSLIAKFFQSAGPLQIPGTSNILSALAPVA
jgi:hypothetical protein